MSESFEDARISAQAMIYDCDIPLLDRLQRAHDHEVKQARKAEYHRGYEDGQHSMDAEHRAVCHKLMRVVLDGDSHTMLSRLAYAIYPCATGWTGESCEGLRERIIELLGGVHDEPVSVRVSGCACGDDCHCGDGQRERIEKLKKQRDGFKRAMVAAQDLLEKRTNERDELQKKLDAIREALDG